MFLMIYLELILIVIRPSIANHSKHQTPLHQSWRRTRQRMMGMTLREMITDTTANTRTLTKPSLFSGFTCRRNAASMILVIFYLFGAQL